MKKTKEQKEKKSTKELVHTEVHILRIERKIMATLADVNAALATLAADVAALKAIPPVVPAATAADLDTVVAQVQAVDAAVKA